MSSKDDLPAYTPRSYHQLGTDSDGFSYEPDKKEVFPSSSMTPVPTPTPDLLPTTNFPSTSYSPGAAFTSSYASPSSLAQTFPSLQPTQSTTTPPSFSRPRPKAPNLTYAAFQPMFLISSSDKSTSLSHGFPMSPPPARDDPHPFITHDVNEYDWLQCVSILLLAIHNDL